MMEGNKAIKLLFCSIIRQMARGPEGDRPLPAPNNEVLDTSEIIPARNKLNKLQRKINRTYRDPFTDGLERSGDDFDDLNHHTALVFDALSNLTTTDFAESFLSYQLGPGYQLSEDDMDGLPPAAAARLRERLTGGLTRQLKPLWLMVAHDPASFRSLSGRDNPPDFLTDQATFLQKYTEVAKPLGLFPKPANIETAQYQRIVSRQSRELAAQMYFYELLLASQDVMEAGARFMAHVSNSLEEYQQYPTAVLQESVIKKAHMNEERVAALQTDGLWENRSDLAAMLVDRGLRETMLDHYGVFRSVGQGEYSGYHVGQNMLALRSHLRSLLRVDFSDKSSQNQE
jgi:hypothetical protein